jgi:4-hydroxybenzoate polyprenyltransferase
MRADRLRRLGDLAERAGRLAAAACPVLDAVRRGGAGVAGPAMVVASIAHWSPWVALGAGGLVVWGFDVLQGLQERAAARRAGDRR